MKNALTQRWLRRVRQVTLLSLDLVGLGMLLAFSAVAEAEATQETR